MKPLSYNPEVDAAMEEDFQRRKKINEQREAKLTIIHISTGGPMRTIQVNGRRYTFEMHPYCGPTILNRKGEPAKKQPVEFLHAASLWAQQGKRIEDGLCRWDHPEEEIPIGKKIGRSFFVERFDIKPARRGE